MDPEEIEWKGKLMTEPFARVDIWPCPDRGVETELNRVAGKLKRGPQIIEE